VLWTQPTSQGGSLVHGSMSGLVLAGTILILGTQILPNLHWCMSRVLLNYCLYCFSLGTAVKLEKKRKELIKPIECSDVLVQCQ